MKHSTAKRLPPPPKADVVRVSRVFEKFVSCCGVAKPLSTLGIGNILKQYVGWHYYANTKCWLNRTLSLTLSLGEGSATIYPPLETLPNKTIDYRFVRGRSKSMISGRGRKLPTTRNDNISFAKQTVKDLTTQRLSVLTTKNTLSLGEGSAKKQTAFTLAEVLITLGIIGVVAAMTIPTLVNNYKKKVTVTQLKHTYSVLVQAYERSKVDHGDPVTWELGGYGESNEYNSNQALRERIAKNYIIPYLTKVKEARYASWGDFGYKYVELYSEWSLELCLNQSGYMISLSDGTILQISVMTKNYGTQENRDDRVISVIISADINGLKMPNARGKDIFIFKIDLNNGKFGFYTYKSPSSRDSALDSCKTDRLLCGYLIMIDGWEIKDGYPWF